MTLDLECWEEPLSGAQRRIYERNKEQYQKAELVIKSYKEKYKGEELFRGECFSILQFSGNITDEALQNILKKERNFVEDKPVKSLSSQKQIKKRKEEEIDEEEIPLAKRFAKTCEKEKPAIGKKEVSKEKKSYNPKTPKKDKSVVGSHRPSEISAIGGLAIEKIDESNKQESDTKTFPSLFVTPRASLRDREKSSSNLSVERNALDSKVKVVLMLNAGKFTEWLIQQGLLKSVQKCALHPDSDLKLGVFSDGSKFPYSGGYVWISECCPTRFVSVFYGSIFEGATNPPSSILKIIYHWSCQTNIQNIVQWVKVTNVYIKLVYTWLRAICTLALYRHNKPIGGTGKNIEIGVISLGTTTSDGKNRTVKVEVLGALDPVDKIIRLRAIEPFSETSDSSYKGRFAKILEPLGDWVLKESTIVTDYTVDRSTLKSMGYNNIIQTNANEGSKKPSNSNIMNYLKKVVPKMFLNTLSLLPNQLVQHFLDELVWREQFGFTPLQTFDNITAHIAEQTRIESRETLIQRLFKVAKFPVKEWKDFIDQTSENRSSSNDAISSQKRVARNSIATKESSFESTSKTYARVEKKIESSLRNLPLKEKDVKPKSTSRSMEVSSSKISNDSDAVGLEEHYYGVLNDTGNQKFPTISVFVGKCPDCKAAFDNNIDLQRHILTHINMSGQIGAWQCVYCVEKWKDEESLKKHIEFSHPCETKNSIASTFNCIICENRFNTTLMLNAHMQKTHVPRELPYKCGCCNYRSSSHRNTVDHFYRVHRNIGVLQCPLCLLPFQIFTNGKTLTPTLIEYSRHLKQYSMKNQCKKCNKCCLSFLSKGSLKVHQLYDHESYSSNKRVKRLLESTIFVQPPKIKNQPTKEIGHYKMKEKFDKMVLKEVEGNMCIECDVGFEGDNHFAGLLKCQKCRYHTCCLRAMMEHTSLCQPNVNPESNVHIKLEKEMHCVCGFSNSDGNSVARHLALCEHKSAYPSVEAAQENTVKLSVLDMLGLMRCVGETNVV